jgi:hypothetical protein
VILATNRDNNVFMHMFHTTSLQIRNNVGNSITFTFQDTDTVTIHKDCNYDKPKLQDIGVHCYIANWR